MDLSRFPPTHLGLPQTNKRKEWKSELRPVNSKHGGSTESWRPTPTPRPRAAPSARPTGKRGLALGISTLRARTQTPAEVSPPVSSPAHVGGECKSSWSKAAPAHCLRFSGVRLSRFFSHTHTHTCARANSHENKSSGLRVHRKEKQRRESLKDFNVTHTRNIEEK